MKRASVLAFGVVAVSMIACGGTSFELGAVREGVLPNAHPAAPDASEVAGDPCKYGNVAGCIDRCQSGEAHACNTVGVLFEYGRAGQPDGTLASGFYSRACEASYAPACTNLAWLYSLGRGVPRDSQQAILLFTRAYDSSRLACRRGDGSGCLLAGELLLQGRVESTDEHEALAFFHQACDQGEARGCDYVSQLE